MAYRIGIDLGGTKIEAVALTSTGEPVWRMRVASPSQSYHLLIATLVDLVHAADAAIAAAGGADASIGVGIPGAIDPQTGLVKNANTVVLIGQPFAQDLAARLGRPVLVQNDANCMIASEAQTGAAKGAAVAFGIILGTGVGGGVALNGRPHLGINAIAGEWGHNPLPWPSCLDGIAETPGPGCYCGKTGCIESFLSGPGLAFDHRLATGRDWQGPEIVAAAADGDPGANAALRRYEDRIARATATVINLLDPDVIVLAGGLSNIDRLYRAVPALWPRYVFSNSVRTRLLPPAHGDASGVFGAAWLWP